MVVKKLQKHVLPNEDVIQIFGWSGLAIYEWPVNGVLGGNILVV